jgi:uncharacterized protein YbbC (DUF1343 family)
LRHAGFNLVRLFSPEHGLGANATDGAAVADGRDPLTGLPVISLYGKRLRPTRESLADLDAVLFDIPDIGTRFYTYIWTLSHVLEACAEAGVPFIVLDRPNPLGGNLAAAEGPMLDSEKFSSFVGRAAIPIRHSLTAGELAHLWNAEWKLDAKLRVIPCSGWHRLMHWPDTGLPFIQTSPAIPSYESALLYPGICLFEATNLSVGRGTEFPFQGIGAPWLNAQPIVDDINSRNLRGQVAEEFEFKPSQSPFAGIHCHGVRLRVTADNCARPVAAGLQLLAAVIRHNRREFRWANYPTAANPGGEGHFEHLIGRAGIREILEELPPNLDQHIEQWTCAAGWAERTKSFLLYA